MDIETLARGLHPLEIRVLRACPERGEAEEKQVRSEAGLEEGQFRRAVQWLLSKEIVAVVREEVVETIRLTELGKAFAAKGTPEMQLLARAAAMPGLTVPECTAGFDLPEEEVRAAFGKLRKLDALRIAGGGVELNQGADIGPFERVSALIARLTGQAGAALAALPADEQETVRSLVHKRMRAKGVFYLERATNLVFALTAAGAEVRAKAFALGLRGEEVSRLTPEMLRDGSWRGKTFRKYSVDFAPPRRVLARRHPYREFLDFVKSKLTSMGFVEMRGPLVECEFWNMDALFMPQFHAAREIHDAYFVKAPTHAARLEPDFLAQVAAAHENGGESGGRGWRYTFDRERTRRLVLRTQGTALSARQLGLGALVPGRYFAMARCFRPDTVDATHACDFFQCEGIALGEEINFRTLLGLLALFATEVAKAEEVKFVPAYFPFTEPSVEAHIRHPRLGWIELGGAGIFRPEVTYPLGVKAPVLAWGLGLDRMAMVALKINDIRELFSRDLDALRTRRLELELY